MYGARASAPQYRRPGGVAILPIPFSGHGHSHARGAVPELRKTSGAVFGLERGISAALKSEPRRRARLAGFWFLLRAFRVCRRPRGNRAAFAASSASRAPGGPRAVAGWYEAVQNKITIHSGRVRRQMATGSGCGRIDRGIANGRRVGDLLAHRAEGAAQIAHRPNLGLLAPRRAGVEDDVRPSEIGAQRNWRTPSAPPRPGLRVGRSPCRPSRGCPYGPTFSCAHAARRASIMSPGEASITTRLYESRCPEALSITSLRTAW